MVTWYGVCLGGVFGALFGSFANVCAHRIPLGLSVVHPPSHCPGCRREIRWFHNIPILGFLILRGRCAGCGRKISLQYPLVEGVSAVLFAVLAAQPASSLTMTVLGGVFTLILLIMAVIDFHHTIIPDVLSLGLLGIGLAVAPLNTRLGLGMEERVIAGLLGAAAGFGFLWGLASLGRRVFKKEALGGGDLKLMAGVGSLLGPTGVFATILLASCLGTGLFLFLKLRRRMAWGTYLPFGPFLAMGAWGYYLFPGPWLRFWEV